MWVHPKVYKNFHISLSGKILTAVAGGLLEFCTFLYVCDKDFFFKDACITEELKSEPEAGFYWFSPKDDMADQFQNLQPF